MEPVGDAPPPPRRQWGEKSRPRGPRELDAADRLQRLQGKAWALTIGLMMGAPAGAFAAGRMGFSPLLGGLVGFTVGVFGVYFGTLGVAGGAARGVGSIYHPSGSSTPPRREYSKAESFVKRGQYADAAAAYELYCLEYSRDPEPYFRLARLHRDQLGNYEEAVNWLQRARADAGLPPGKALLAAQEIVELYVHKLRTPRRAIPELAHICKHFADTPAAESARRELAEMRQLLAGERDGAAQFTSEFLARFERGVPTDTQEIARSVLDQAKES